MTRIIDKTGRIATIEMNYYQEPNWSPDCSQDWIVPESIGYDRERDAYIVDYTIEDLQDFATEWSEYRAETDLDADEEDLEAERRHYGERCAYVEIITKTRTFKVYGSEGHRQRESFDASKVYDFSEGGETRVVELINSDITGTNDYTIVKVTADSSEAALRELEGQITDGIFENSRVGKITEILEDGSEVEAAIFEG